MKMLGKILVATDFGPSAGNALKNGRQSSKKQCNSSATSRGRGTSGNWRTRSARKALLLARGYAIGIAEIRHALKASPARVDGGSSIPV